jgi:hypothetical protein
VQCASTNADQRVDAEPMVVDLATTITFDFVTASHLCLVLAVALAVVAWRSRERTQAATQRTSLRESLVY